MYDRAIQIFEVLVSRHGQDSQVQDLANMLGTRAEVTAELGYIDRARADGRRALAILERVMTSGRDYLVSIEKEHKSLQIRLAGLL